MKIGYGERAVYQKHFLLCLSCTRPVDFGEDRLGGKGRLPETFFVVTKVKYLILINKVS